MMSNVSAVTDALKKLASGRVDEAVSDLTRSADAGSAEALMQLAVWRLTGQPLLRDLPLAREYIRRAVVIGHVDGALMEVALTANGGGGPPSWPDALDLLRTAARADAVATNHLALLSAMALDEDGQPLSLPPPEQLAEDAKVVRFRTLLTPGECGHVAMTARDLMEPASVLDPRTGRHITHPIRTSDGAVIGPTREDLVIQALNRRIAAISGTAVEHGESLAVLRYAPGQQYRLHHDAIAGAANQRIKTVLVYLNDGYGGGQTAFPSHNLVVQPRAGDAIVFTNTDADGDADEKARHAGLPVTKGVKWLATRWIRAAPISPWDGV